MPPVVPARTGFTDMAVSKKTKKKAVAMRRALAVIRSSQRGNNPSAARSRALKQKFRSAQAKLFRSDTAVTSRPAGVQEHRTSTGQLHGGRTKGEGCMAKRRR